MECPNHAFRLYVRVELRLLPSRRGGNLTRSDRCTFDCTFDCRGEYVRLVRSCQVVPVTRVERAEALPEVPPERSSTERRCDWSVLVERAEGLAERTGSPERAF